MKKILSLLALVALSSTALAQVTWDGDIDSKYTNDTNWVGDTAPADDLTTDTAQFIGGTVDLDTSRQVSGLDFITAGTTLTGGGTLEVGASGVTGGQNLTLSGSTTVDLNGTDTALNYTGDITIGAGSKIVSERNAIRLDTGTHADTTITLDGGEISAIGDHLDLTGRTIDLTANGGTLRHAHARNIYGIGDISGIGQLTIANEGASSTAGRVQLQGNNTYQGGTRIEQGGQAWSYSDASFGLAGTSITLADGGTYFAANSVDLGTREIIVESGGLNGRINTSNKSTTMGGSLSGSGDLDVVGSGTLNLTASSASYAGNTTIDGAAVRFGTQGNALGSGTTVTLDNGGEIAANGGTHIDMSGISSIVVTTNGGTLRHAHARNMYNLSGVVISGDGELTLAGSPGSSDAGRIQLQGANIYTGGTRIIENGQAWVYSDASLGAAGTAITFDGGDYYAANSVNLGSRAINVAAGNGEIKLNNKTTTIEGEIAGAGALTLTGTGNLNITSQNNTNFTGGTTINAGQVNLYGQDGALGTGDITLDNGGTLKNRDNHPTLSNNIILGAGGGELEAGWNKTLNINGTVSGAGELTVNPDSGQIRLSGHNDHSGGTKILGNVLAKHSDSLGTGTVTIDGGYLQNNNSAPVFANSFTIGAGGAELKAGWGKNVTLDGVISGSGAVTVLSDSGVLVLNGDSDYTGLLTVNGGGRLGGDGAIDGDLTVDAGGLLVFSTTENLDVAGAVSLDSTFGIDDLIGISSSTADGDYLLLGETATAFSGFENIGLGNAYDLTGGKSAYFEDVAGGLQVTVIPEPATLGLVAVLGGGILFIRRRFKI